MIRKIRSKLTYANTMATIAVFMVLGGSAYAVARNSVGTPQLKNNAVKPAKIAPGAVKTAKIANNAVTGAKVNEASLGPVPEAAQVAGLSARKYTAAAPSPSSGVSVASYAGLTLTLNCNSAGVSPTIQTTGRLFASSATNGSITTPDGSFTLTGGNPAVEVAVQGPNIGQTTLGDFVYANSDAIVSGQYRFSTIGGGVSICLMSGTLLGG